MTKLWGGVAALVVIGTGGAFVACASSRDDAQSGGGQVLSQTSEALTRVQDARNVCAPAGDAGAGVEAGVGAEAGTPAAAAPDGGALTTDAGAGSGAPPIKAASAPLTTPADPALAGYRALPTKVEPIFENLPSGASPTFTLGRDAASAWSLEDVGSGVSAKVKLVGASPSPAALGSDGHLVYAHALGTGSHAYLRASATSIEDSVLLPVGTTRSDVVYEVTLGARVAGLRLVANSLELLDATGSPRLRVDAPKITDASCTDHWAQVSVEGCSIDTSPAPPWGRSVTASGASTCRVRVAWTLADLALPAIVDPTWSYASTMPGGVWGGHEAVVLADGRVMVAGNSSGGAPANSAVLYNPATNTWATTGSLTTGRYFHSLTRLQDGRVLAAGGIAASTGLTLSSAERWSSSTGTWEAAGTMAGGARARHAAVLLADDTIVTPGNAGVLVAGSDVGGGVNGPPPALYLPASNSWTTTTGATSVGPGRATLTRLSDGRVVQAGGRFFYVDDDAGAYVPYATSSLVLYTPSTNTWAAVSGPGSLKHARYAHAAVRVGTKVLFVGGSNNGALASSELWDPAGPLSTLVGSMQTAREELSVSLDNLGAPLVHTSGWYSGGAVERFNTTSNTWASAPGLTGGGWFYYGRTRLLPNGLTMSFGVNATSAFSPTQAATLQRACPSPLPAETSCMTAGVCDGNGNYTPPQPKALPCCEDGGARPQGTFCSNETYCQGRDTCDGDGGCIAVPTFPVGTDCSPSPCVAGTCGADAGCQIANRPAGTSCSTGDTCGGARVCAGDGGCLPGTPLDAGTPCVAGGGCRMDTCGAAGTCLAGTAYSPDDKSTCTNDICGGAVGSNTWNGSCSTPPNLPVGTPNRGMATALSFLYTGPGASQQGVTATIDPVRISVVRGRVMKQPGLALEPASGVTVNVVGHPELGTTSTRSDGWFDFALNGGERYVLEFTSPTMLPVHRTVAPLTHDWKILDDIVQTSPVAAASGALVVGGSEAVIVGVTAGTDLDGPRTARIYFPAGTHVVDKEGVTLVPDGQKVCFDITEYTTDARGPQRMPGELPSTSGYTYAVDLTMRGPIAAGATCVAGLPAIASPYFQTPQGTTAALWIDNFLGLAASGPEIPTGVYDRAAGVWREEPSGALVSVPFPTSIPAPERTAAGAFPGTSFMRVPITHFSEYDTNWGIGPPDDATEPELLRVETFPPCSKTAKGSIIGCEAQTLGESIAITGTPFSLEYRSHRTRAYKTQIRVPLAGNDLPTSPYWLGTELVVDIAGRRFEYSFGKVTKNQSYTFEWDGLDAYGRLVTGTQRASVHLGYTYAAERLVRTRAFGASPRGGVITGVRRERRITIWKYLTTSVSRFDAKDEAKLGGWTLSPVDRLDVGEAIAVEQGNGERNEISPLNEFAERGNVSNVVSVPNLAPDERIRDMIEAGDGTIYIATLGTVGARTAGRILKRTVDGTISVVAGQQRTVAMPSGFDGALANEAAVNPLSLALDLQGRLLFADRTSIWRIEPSTMRLKHIAGQTAPYDGVPCTYSPDTCKDDGPATLAKFAIITAIVMSPDGTLYVADAGQNATVRRIGVEGRIDTLYDSGVGGEGKRVVRLDIQEDGTLFGRLWDGKLVDIRPMALAPAQRKSGTQFYDACPGLNGGYDNPAVVLSSQGILAGCMHGIYVNVGGIIRRVAGDWNANGMVLRRTSRREVLFVLASSYDRIKRLTLPIVTTPLGAAIPSPDGSSVTTFNMESGRPIQTASAERGAIRWRYGFDGEGRIASVFTDDGLITSIVKQSDTVIEITAPGGQVTTLRLDPVTGYLAQVTHPGGSSVTLEHGRAEYGNDGLLLSMLDERGGLHRFDYNVSGRLVRDRDARPSSAGQTLVRQDKATGFEVTLTSPEGRAVTLGRQPLNLAMYPNTAGNELRTTKWGNLLWRTFVSGDKSFRAESPDGSWVEVDAMLQDPQWGTATPFPSTTTRGFVPNFGSTTTQTRSLGAVDSAGNPSRNITLAVKLWPSQETRTSTAAFDVTTGRWVTTSAQGRVVRVQLDSRDRPTRVELGSAPFEIEPVEYGYDSLGRLETVMQGQRLWKTTYDAANYPLTISSPGPTDPGAGVPTPITTTFLSRDARGRPLTVSLPGGRIVEMSYDAAGNVTTVRTPAGHLHGFTYDWNDRLASYTAPIAAGSTGPSTYTRDFDGLVQIAESPGPVASFAAFDAFGRLSSTTVAGATRTPTFDGAGRLSALTLTTPVPTLPSKVTRLSDSSFVGPLAQTSDMSGSAVLPGGQTARLTRTFNGLAQVTAWQVAAPTTGPSIGLAYDNDGLLTSAGAASPLVLGRSTHTGLVKTATFSALAEAFGWSTYGEPSTYAVKVGPETNARFELAYERDTAGRVSRRTETTRDTGTAPATVVTYDYTYDDAGRLVEEKKTASSGTTNIGWWYDANGNRFPDAAKLKANYDEQDRLLWLEPSAALRYEYGYKANGELSARTTKVSGVTTESASYVYDVEGNLASATIAPTNLSTYRVDYEVDALNRRVRRTTTKPSAPVQVFVWDGPRLVAELDGNGALKATFVYATQGHSPDLVITTSGGTHTAYRLLKDQLGSIRQVVDGNGNVVQRLDYDAWGNITNEVPALTGTTLPFQPFGFAGGLHDRDTGFVRFGARDYDPKSGRWTSKDASLFAGGSNFYAYSFDSPNNLIDPTGHWPRDAWELRSQAADGGYGPQEALAELQAFLFGALALRFPYIAFAALSVPSERELPLLGFAGNPGAGICGATAEAEAVASFGPSTVGAAQRGVPALSRTMLSQSRVIARGDRIRDVGRLVEQYGGKARDWVKKSSPPMEIDGLQAEVHWYEARGIGRVEEKIKWLE